MNRRRALLLLLLLLLGSPVRQLSVGIASIYQNIVARKSVHATLSFDDSIRMKLKQVFSFLSTGNSTMARRHQTVNDAKTNEKNSNEMHRLMKLPAAIIG